MSFLKAGLRGHNFLGKNIGVFNNFLPKKFEEFRGSVVEQWSSNARVASSKTFFLCIDGNFDFSTIFFTDLVETP